MALRGIFPVLATPFDEQGEVDEASLRRLVDFTIDAGANGMVATGFAGEVWKLQSSERQRVLQITLDQAAGRVPVIAGTGAEATVPTVALTTSARAAGAAAAMVRPPAFVKYGQEALTDHFATVAAVGLPVMLQDHPVLTGVSMSAEWIAGLLRDVPGIAYVKMEAPPTPEKGGRVIDLSGGTAQVFGGRGAIAFWDELSRGFCGSLPNSAYPEVSIAVYHRFRAGDVAGALDVQRRFAMLLQMTTGQTPEHSIAVTKALLHRRGIIRLPHTRKPGLSLSRETLATLHTIWQAVDLDRWLQRSPGEHATATVASALAAQ
jgi:dihydrodipicolinate synthase/N-acetylneuraminate lyase